MSRSEYKYFDPKSTGKYARQLWASPSNMQPAPAFRALGYSLDGTHREPLLVWKDIKPEMYALAGVLSVDIMERALRDHLTTSPEILGPILTKSRGEHETVEVFANLVHFTEESLSKAIQEEKTQAMSRVKPDHPHRRIWQRFLEMDKFLNKDVRHRNYPRSSTTLEGGANTGILTIVNTLWTIAILCESHPEGKNPQYLTSVARNSYPLVAYLSMLGIHEFSNEHDYLYMDSKKIAPTQNFVLVYDPNKFCLRHANGGLGLQIKEHVSGPSSHKPTAPWAEPKIGCPAMINLGDDSAIRKLWDWHIDIAPFVFETYLKFVN